MRTKNKGIILLILGILIMITTGMMIINRVIIAIQMDYPELAIGNILGGGLIFILGVLLTKKGYQKIKTAKK